MIDEHQRRRKWSVRVLYKRKLSHYVTRQSPENVSWYRPVRFALSERAVGFVESADRDKDCKVGYGLKQGLRYVKFVTPVLRYTLYL
jgi:hypothetical protein